jgi:hypothetical protein
MLIILFGLAVPDQIPMPLLGYSGILNVPADVFLPMGLLLSRGLFNVLN